MSFGFLRLRWRAARVNDASSSSDGEGEQGRADGSLVRVRGAAVGNDGGVSGGVAGKDSGVAE